MLKRPPISNNPRSEVLSDAERLISAAERLEKLAVPVSTRAEPPQDSFAFLDVVLVLVKNIKSLILVPIVAGAAAYGLSCLAQKSYTSVAVFKSDVASAGVNSAVAASAETLVKTSSVLDSVASQFSVPGDTADQRRAALLRMITITKMRNEQLVTLAVSSDNPEAARAISGAVISAWLPLVKPVGTQLKMIGERIRLTEADIRTTASRIARFESESTNAEFGPALLKLYQMQVDSRKELSKLKAAAEGQNSADVIISAPTLPQDGDNRYWFAGPAAAVLALLLLVVATLIRGFAHSSGAGSAEMRKINEIKFALSPLSPRH
jgi:hypothetical protein